jgi:Ca2+-binding RTX toxin-like protein
VVLAAALVAWAAAGGSSAAAPSPPPVPSCEEGPVRAGRILQGTPCGETIVAPPGVAVVRGGGGDDRIVAAPIAAAVESCPGGCLLGVGSQTFEGGPGNDVVYGQRGNDTLRGGGGDDQLYGGIGDDLLLGGPGNDRLAGGFGADTIDGEEGDDYVRGDGTIDHIFDQGGGTDTLSYSTGVTPGFGPGVSTGAAGFPTGAEGERGVFLDLSPGAPELNGNDGIAALGGGVDQVQLGAFERIVGTPYSDYIVGSDAGETIEGGGGADVIAGEGGEDVLRGGADGDDLDGGDGGDSVDGEAGTDVCRNATTVLSCTVSPTKSVTTRDTAKVSVGLMTAQGGLSQLYLTGSSGKDVGTATYSPVSVVFELASGSFDTSAAASAGCTVAAAKATCALTAPLDSLVLAGMGGEDSLAATGFPPSTGLVVTGGVGGDTLSGGEQSEDVLVDGPGTGADALTALGGDDALLHNGGPDDLGGGSGNDLFLSVSLCDGEALDGADGRDNSSWARLTDTSGVAARLADGDAGRPGPGGAPQCTSGSPDSLAGIEDLEGSEFGDALVGDGGPNQLLGHRGPDRYLAEAGDDSILANSGDDDPLIDCGEGTDSALIDRRPRFDDAVPTGCESVQEAEPNSFQIPTVPPPPVPEPPPEPQPPPPRPPRPPRDRTAPQTRLLAHPARLLFLSRGPRRGVFRFASNEPGSRFRCRLDRRPYRPCSSPRAYRVAAGRHTFGVFAVDAAGNRDPTPARFAFRARHRRRSTVP